MMMLRPARSAECHTPVGTEALDALVIARSAARGEEAERLLEVAPDALTAAAVPPDGGQIHVGARALVAGVRAREGRESLFQSRRRLHQVATPRRAPPERLLRPPHRDAVLHLGRDHAGALGEHLPTVEPSLAAVGLGQERREPALEHLHPELPDEGDGLIERRDGGPGLAVL